MTHGAEENGCPEAAWGCGRGCSGHGNLYTKTWGHLGEQVAPAPGMARGAKAPRRSPEAGAPVRSRRHRSSPAAQTDGVRPQTGA